MAKSGSVPTTIIRISRRAGGTGEAELPASCGKVSDWALSAVRWAYGAGILTVSDLTNPTQSATRALLAQMLVRFEALK